ncbi:MAG: 23S rRNA (adenine(2503)-C(2))-methyltransferase RlmN [Candidatus Auribacter fodinae]|jgi:23S rRNA (adenine2503-C2)-methyltransferase|uniref:Probable dual-specificity RNA methyltransferase RlmN n=1 Tax=Candidatus Auribacter fodinae TaxID=2093366 RepID=A0A3A4QVF9_9BACT|nr:MAG: 23S rRNA (adenine(2503)-C(2))-methyltransferase RlmN [Candidatus Auribacter fodinae]
MSNTQDIPRYLAGLTKTDCEKLFQELDQPRYRASQLLQWIFRHNALSYSEMSNLPGTLLSELAKRYQPCSLTATETVETPDKSARKYLMRTADNHLIESVAITHEKRHTLCISSQIGCAFACGFCASGKAGFIRNLCAAEMIDQIRIMTQEHDMTNLVFMGSGEPLHNFNAFEKAYESIHSSWGFELGQRKITVSTVGYIPGIEELTASNLRPILALSLHSTRDDQRSSFMPINKQYSIHAVLDSCRKYADVSGRDITIEYLVIPEFNSSDDDVKRLVSLLKKYPAKINLIPLNEVDEFPFAPPTEDQVYNFFNKIKDSGLDVTIRWSKGSRIAAACGQLRAQRGS